MIGDGQPDRFEIVNGPEDGTEFPIARTPVDIGSDPACAILLRLDPTVRHIHARVTVVSEGYRIRRLGGGTVQINGKRAGLIRSRIVRHGGIVRIGNTDLSLQIAGDGLARRSYGLPTESDIGWAAGLMIRWAGRAIPASFQWAWGLFGGTLRWIVPFALLLVIIEYIWPGTIAEGREYSAALWERIRYWIWVFTNR